MKYLLVIPVLYFLLAFISWNNQQDDRIQALEQQLVRQNAAVHVQDVRPGPSVGAMLNVLMTDQCMVEMMLFSGPEGPSEDKFQDCIDSKIERAADIDAARSAPDDTPPSM